MLTSPQSCQPSLIWPSGRPVHRPFRGLLGVHSRYGLHTRAVTVYRDTLSEGFSHFVTSIAAPVASGWSVWRVGLAPTGKRRLITAHATSGHSAPTHRAHSGNPAFRRPSINSFAFDCPPRAIAADIVKAGSISSRRVAASRASASRPRWALADARTR